MTVILLVDASASGGSGSVSLSKRELAAEVAAVLAFSAIANNDKVGLLLFTDKTERYNPPGQGARACPWHHQPDPDFLNPNIPAPILPAR